MIGKHKHVVMRCHEDDGRDTWDIFRMGKVVHQGLRTRAIAQGTARHLDLEESLEVGNEDLSSIEKALYTLHTEEGENR